MATAPIEAASPVEIDTQLADLNGKLAAATARIDGVQRSLAHPRARFHEAEYRQQLATAREQERGLLGLISPLEAEYRRRGGWTRAFLVTGSNGHVHRSTRCNTCFPTTQFAWLPQVSGMDESEIVALAGEKACTVCYPTAPVDALRQPYRLDTPDRIARDEAGA